MLRFSADGVLNRLDDDIGALNLDVVRRVRHGDKPTTGNGLHVCLRCQRRLSRDLQGPGIDFGWRSRVGFGLCRSATTSAASPGVVEATAFPRAAVIWSSDVTSTRRPSCSTVDTYDPGRS